MKVESESKSDKRSGRPVLEGKQWEEKRTVDSCRVKTSARSQVDYSEASKPLCLFRCVDRWKYRKLKKLVT